MKKTWLAVAASIGFLATPVAAQTTSMPDVDLFAVGDVWEWRQIDNRTKLQEATVTRALVEENGQRVFASEGMRRPLQHPYVGEPSSKPWRVWPLEVGKRWSMDVDYTRVDGTGNIKMDAHVVAYEEVTVPAGTFMAFRIEHDGFVRTGGFNGRMTETFWYAPAARADVKHIRRVASTNFTRELVKYPRPGQPATTAQTQAAPPVPAAAPSASAAGPAPAQPAADSRVQRLRELEQMRKEGLITQQEYDEKRKAILSAL